MPNIHLRLRKETLISRKTSQVDYAALDLDLSNAFARFLELEVANGDPSPDTVCGYRAQVTGWLRWCREQGIAPIVATDGDVRTYRADLIRKGYRRASIAHKLVAVKRLYDAALSAGLCTRNPGQGIRPPRLREANENLRYLEEEELRTLFDVLPQPDTVRNRRDRALIALLALQGLRTIEAARANTEDLTERAGSWILLVRGKGRNRLCYLRRDVAEAINDYVQSKIEVVADPEGTPLFTAIGNRSRGRRVSRRSLRRIVDSYLRKAGLKRSGVSGHALRASTAILSYRHTKDLRAVQEMLGHADPKTTARYVRIVDMAERNPAAALAVGLTRHESR